MSAKLGELRSWVLELSLGGAKVLAEKGLPIGERTTCSFAWEGQHLRYDVEVIESETSTIQRFGKNLRQVVIVFLKAGGESDAVLRGLIESQILRALDEQKSNARGVPPLAPTFVPSPQHSDGYICYRLRGRTWDKTNIASAEQPSDGFTLSAREKSEEVDLLCRNYMAGSSETRRMIRKMAELSVSSAQGIPTRKYIP